MVVLGEEGTNDLSLVAVKSEWQEVWELMQRYHL
jgi:hypothetical protein